MGDSDENENDVWEEATKEIETVTGLDSEEQDNIIDAGGIISTGSNGENAAEFHTDQSWCYIGK